MTFPVTGRSRRLDLAARRFAAASFVASGVLMLVAGPASAHVSVDAGGAGAGADDVVLTFRVPNERSDATTVKIDIKFPTRTPIASVKPENKPGWTVTTTRTTLATPVKTVDGELTKGVTEVVYTATSPENGVQVDTFETFRMLVGPLPDGVTSIAFPTVQTYSSGQVSSWIEPSIAGTEPQHPAPVLALTPGPGGGPEGGPGGISVSGAGVASAPTHEQVRTATFVGVVGVVTGSMGLLVAGIAVGRTRRNVVPLASSGSKAASKGAASDAASSGPRAG